jgi:hypothetical protein
VTETTGLALVFVVLLGLEWRYRLKSVRLATALLAVGALWFFQPDITTVRRVAFSKPRAEWVTKSAPHRVLSEYQMGVLTTVGEFSRMMKYHADARRLSIGVLFWLACSPILRRAPARSSAEGAARQLGPEGPDA